MSLDESSLRPVASQDAPALDEPALVLAALRELVRLKDIKDHEGESDDYRLKKDQAWAEARRVLARHFDRPEV